MADEAKSSISEVIDRKVGEVRTDNFDITFGEIVSLYNSEELIIDPEYQRLFRWSNEQRSRLIESILLELPIPQIFVIETESGALELIDGLQRISSVIQFIQHDSLGLDQLSLQGCELVKELNGMLFSDLPLVLQLKLKRSKVRAVIIKRQSKGFLRYEMFKRLNTGGANLQPQEIRNVSARMLGEHGVEFYSFLKELSLDENFKIATEALSSSDRDQKGDEELILRFFALKNALSDFKGSVRDWLDAYMDGILVDEPEAKIKKYSFDYESEAHDFRKVFGYISRVMGAWGFVKYRDGNPIGGLAPAYYESVTMGILRSYELITGKQDDVVRSVIIDVLQSKEFKDNTGPAANTRPKLNQRISLVEKALQNA